MEMNDEQFLWYCKAHAETPRHLFHARHVKRLHDLAGVECEPLGENQFYGMDVAFVAPLFEKAMTKMRAA